MIPRMCLVLLWTLLITTLNCVNGQRFSASCQPLAKSQRWFNWDEQITQTTRYCAAPRNVNELRYELELARATGGSVKVFGGGFSFSDIAKGNFYNASNPRSPSHVMISMQYFTGAMVVDSNIKTATFGSGWRIYDVCEELQKHGLAIENVGTELIQSYVGAAQTGTHGAGKNLGNIAKQILSFYIMLANGTIRFASANSEYSRLFYAGRVGLGAIGIILNVTIQAVDAFKLKRTDRLIPTSVLLSELETLMANTSQWMAWAPHIVNANGTGKTVTQAHVTFWDRVPLSTPTVSCDAIQRCWNPNLGLSGNNSVSCTDWGFKALGQSPRQVDSCIGNWVWPAIVEHFFPLTCNGDSSNYKNALLSYMQNTLSHGGQLPSGDWRNGVNGGSMFETEAQFQLRFVRGDDSWMSEVYTTNPNEVFGIMEIAYQPLPPQDLILEARWQSIVLELGKIGERHCYRPHWAKLSSINSTWLTSAYPKFLDFLAVRNEVDPACIFVNEYLKNKLGIPCSTGTVSPSKIPSRCDFSKCLANRNGSPSLSVYSCWLFVFAWVALIDLVF